MRDGEVRTVDREGEGVGGGGEETKGEAKKQTK